MTKAQLINELKGIGEVWADSSYSKAELERYWEESQKASEMSMEELMAEIKRRTLK